MNQNIDMGEALAIISALGALAAFLSNDGGSGSTRPIIDLPSNFGQELGSNSDMDESSDDSEVVGDDTQGSSEWNFQDGTEFWDPGDYDFGGPSGGTGAADSSGDSSTDSSGDWEFQDPSDNPATDSGGVYDGGMW